MYSWFRLICTKRLTLSLWAADPVPLGRWPCPSGPLTLSLWAADPVPLGRWPCPSGPLILSLWAADPVPLGRWPCPSGPLTLPLCVNLSQVTSHFLASPSQVTSHLVRRQVKSSHKSFGSNTRQVTSLFVQVQVKSHIILSSCNTQSGPGIKSIYSELQSKIYEMVNGI